MLGLIKKLAAASAVLVVASLLSATTAHAQRTYTVNTGATYVTLSSDFVTAITSLKVTAGTVGPTQLVRGAVNFPVTGGAIDLDSATGQILHSGGVTLTAGSTVVKLESFIIDTTGKAPVISGIVVANGQVVGRINLFDITWPSSLSVPLTADAGILQIRGATLTLDAGAATALNGVFNVSAFAGGLNIGTADVFALVPLSIAAD
jgi:hypothetical protein